MEYATLQDIFDAFVYMPAETHAMYAELESTVRSNMDAIKNGESLDTMYDGFSEVAGKYGVDYVNPKYTRTPTVVSNNATVH